MKSNRKLKNLQAQLIEAEAATKRYSEGRLNDLEIQLRCNSESLTKSWKGTVERLKIEIKKLNP